MGSVAKTFPIVVYLRVAMPANLTAQYLVAAQQYREADSAAEQLRCLEAMLRELPKHKGTDKLHAELKQKISRAKAEVDQAKKSGAKSGGFRLLRQGAGCGVILGGPNAGKSQLLSTLTRATPEIAPYPFTTRQLSVGMMPWEDISVQLVDTPPITADYLDPQVLSVIRMADVVLLVVDLETDDGIADAATVVDCLQATRTRLAEQSYVDADDLGVSFTRTLVVFNKIDLPESNDRMQLWREFSSVKHLSDYAVSATEGTGLEQLKRAIFESLGVVRVYTKLPTQKQPNLERPFVLRQGGSLIEVAAMIHCDVAAKFRFARVWGSRAGDGAIVQGDYLVQDRDVVEIHA